MTTRQVYSWKMKAFTKITMAMRRVCVLSLLVQFVRDGSERQQDGFSEIVL